MKRLTGFTASCCRSFLTSPLRRDLSLTSQSIVLKEFVDSGLPEPDHFKIQAELFDEEKAKSDLQDGGFIVEVKALSVDPFQRATIRSDGKHKSAVKVGEPLNGFVVGNITHSKNSHWKVGDLFGAGLPFVTRQIVTPEILKKTAIWKLTGHVTDENLTYGLGILGMPGSTAYGGLTDILRPKKGETIFISSASGTVGGLVGMMAKQIFECKTIGSCGGPAKGEFIKNVYGFDHAIDYKQAKSVDDLVIMLKEVAPKGIDMYFENVGGIHFEAAFQSLRPGGRIAVCGFISEYNNDIPNLSSFNPMNMIYTHQRIEGFVCIPWLIGKRGTFLADVSKWLKEGKLVVHETKFNGIEKWPQAFQALFTGNYKGKIVVTV
jgi:NADPH-dependent curcumin reductase CurA